MPNSETLPPPLPPLVEVTELKVYFRSGGGVSRFFEEEHEIRAVDDVSFKIAKGETMGLVGESGSGKTTVGKAIVHLVQPHSGMIKFAGTDITNLDRQQMLPYRRKIQVIFQDPYSSLNPRLTIESIIAEPLQIHFPEMDRHSRRERILELLTMVGLEKKHLSRYPHEFSGGQRQRIGIARALAVKPEFIICDEAVSALDVSVQAQIVNLLLDLQEQFHLTYLFIAHDLAIVEHMSDEILVMHRGKIVERGPAETICSSPAHEYTKKLLAAVPQF